MEKQFTVAGIVTMSNGLTTVRFTNDMIGRIKTLVAGKAQRIDFVELPEPMNKEQALAYISTLEKFSSEEDQRIISDANDRHDDASAQKAPATERTRKPRVAKVIDPLEAIRKREKQELTPEQILAIAMNPNRNDSAEAAITQKEENHQIDDSNGSQSDEVQMDPIQPLPVLTADTRPEFDISTADEAPF